jgi:NodT family efflux transporter outer membrane factor (OMF) lipoprotein
MQIHREGSGPIRGAGWIASACLVAAAALGLGGCTTSLPDYIHNGFKVGPNYHRPPTPVPPKWIDQGSDPRIRVGHPNLATWWDVFGDPQLADLIRQSYSSNLTLRAAGFEVLAAISQRNIARGELLPQSQTANFTYSHIEATANGGNAAAAGAVFGTSVAPPATAAPVTVPTTPIAGVAGADSRAQALGTTTPVTTVGSTTAVGGTKRFFDNWATSLNLSWELDFWGLFRRNVEAANANLDQSVFNSDEMTVLLLANVATQYVEIRTLQRRLELARQNVALQEPLVAQFEKLYKAGVANSLPGYQQLRANLENTKALIPTLEITLRQANDELCNLLGIPVQDLLPRLGAGRAADPADASKQRVRIPQPLDYAVVVGIPGDVLLQRPDVKAVEAQLRIQSADIGIAEAEMYPHIAINGSIGLAANQFGKLFDERSGTGTIGPSLTWNILNYGRLLGNVRLQDRVYQQRVAEYQQAILNANQDAENALVAYLQSIEQERHLRESADAATELTAYLVRQLKSGYLPPGSANTSAFINQMFTAVNFMVTQQDAAAQAEGNIALNLILLYRAMGGGWQLRLAHGAHPCPLPGTPREPANGPAAGKSNAAPPEVLPAPKPVPPPRPGPENLPRVPLMGSTPGDAAPHHSSRPVLELDDSDPAPAPDKRASLGLDDH